MFTPSCLFPSEPLSSSEIIFFNFCLLLIVCLSLPDTHQSIRSRGRQFWISRSSGLIGYVVVDQRSLWEQVKMSSEKHLFEHIRNVPRHPGLEVLNTSNGKPQGCIQQLFFPRDICWFWAENKGLRIQMQGSGRGPLLRCTETRRGFGKSSGAGETKIRHLKGLDQKGNLENWA